MVLEKAQEEGIGLEEDHWAVIVTLQEQLTHHDDSKKVNCRLLHDALTKRLHTPFAKELVGVSISLVEKSHTRFFQ